MSATRAYVWFFVTLLVVKTAVALGGFALGTAVYCRHAEKVYSEGTERFKEKRSGLVPCCSLWDQDPVFFVQFSTRTSTLTLHRRT